jgi:hypothetical protein
MMECGCCAYSEGPEPTKNCLRNENERLRAVIDEIAGALLRAKLIPDDMGGQVEDGSG